MARDTVRPVWPSRTDVASDGTVRCYDLQKKKYIRAFPIDIREAMKSDKPSIAQFSPDDDKKLAKEVPEDDLVARINKANATELKKIADELKLELDFSSAEKVADKRKLLLNAI